MLTRLTILASIAVRQSQYRTAGARTAVCQHLNQLVPLNVDAGTNTLFQIARQLSGSLGKSFQFSSTEPTGGDSSYLPATS